MTFKAWPTKQALSGEAVMNDRWRVLLLLFLGTIINGIDRGNLSLASPALMREFERSPAAMGALLSAFFWTYVVFQIPAGYVVDRFDLKWVYGTAFVVWSLTSAVMGFAHSFSQLFILRIILGIAESPAIPANLAYVKRHFSSQEQGWPTGISTAGVILGPAIGSFFGGLLLERYSWRVLFISTGLGACLWLVPWFGFYRTSYIRGQKPVLSPRLGSVEWKRLFRLRVTWAIAIGSFLYAYCWNLCLAWLPSYFVMARGFSFARMGAFTALPLVIMAVMSPLGGRGADLLIVGSRSPLCIRKAFVCCGFAIGSSLVAVLIVRTSAGLMGILAVSFLGLGLASANFWALTQTICPPSIIGTAIAFQNGVANLAGMSAPIVTGWLISRTKSFSLAIISASLCLLTAAVVFMLFIRQEDVTVIRERATCAA